jgi:NAD(P)-dependent dehydrogenase (short-subunit alcohol dehydrogenase family)
VRHVKGRILRIHFSKRSKFSPKQNIQVGLQVQSKNMNIVITGAGKGIGLAIVKHFLNTTGHNIWACSRDVSALQALSAPRLHSSTLDIASATATEIATLVSAQFNEVDLLIHNAGLLVNEPFETTSLEDWRRVFEVNVFSAVKINQALLPLLRKSSGAHVVHIGSMGGVQGSSKFPGLSAYSASKAALANLTECMAEELKTTGIHVNCLALGAVDTEMLRKAFPGYTAGTSSEEMAAFICDFSLNSRAFFNGKTLAVASSTP